jgi:acetyl-CoA C-acetyltransferase
MADYLGLNLRHFDTTDTGGASYVAHVGHAAAAVATGKASVALITMAGLPRSLKQKPVPRGDSPDEPFEAPYGPSIVGLYAMAASRHMYEFGTTAEQLAEIKVAASKHASHNPNAFLKNAVTVEEVVNSPLIADPLKRLECCVVTDGGGALVIVSPEIAKSLGRRAVKILGEGVAAKHHAGGRIDLTYTGAALSGPKAFAEAGVKPSDIDYASIYDSFTITVLETIEDLGFCEKGEGGKFVLDGALEAPFGKLPFNTDGGSLCNNHPGNRGGMIKMIEAVRQVRGEANPAVQVPDCELALVHGTGGTLGARHAGATVILGREDA